MGTFLVTLTGDSREVYEVVADTPEEATKNWDRGDLVIQESYGMGVDSVTVVD